MFLSCFFVYFPPLLGGTGWLEWPRVEYFSSPSWKARVDWSLVFLFHQLSKGTLTEHPGRLDFGKIVSPEGSPC